ncbi:MAG: hypothetical protein J2P46_01045 [Zavarzinella sp.]|nr:hypothetical protein [Zavarzinella sp.]
MAISNRQLRDAFLTPPMACYFAKKLPALDPAELGIRIEEALKFLNIATYCRGSIPVSKEIDDIWHLWILETNEYDRLCRALQGGQFIHHSSNAYLNCCGAANPPPGDELEHKVEMLGTYVRNYGPFQADRLRYWPFAAHLVDDVGWSLDQLNEWLGRIL